MRSDILNYYIIDRRSGISYDPFCIIGNFMAAHSNRATDKGVTRINVPKIVTGLSHRRYRLVNKNIF